MKWPPAPYRFFPPLETITSVEVYQCAYFFVIVGHVRGGDRRRLIKVDRMREHYPTRTHPTPPDPTRTHPTPPYPTLPPPTPQVAIFLSTSAEMASTRTRLLSPVDLRDLAPKYDQLALQVQEGVSHQFAHT